MSTEEILRISRPRFWLYTAGPYLIGLAAAAHSASELTGSFVWLFLLYFLFPANLFIYGINDIYDFETDKLNPKKRNYEGLITPHKRRPLLRAIVATNLPFAGLVCTAAGLTGQYTLLASFVAFVLFSLFYSAPPIRAKAKPLLDSLFNILYLFPGWFGFYLVGGHGFSWRVFFVGTLWVMAMHAFSAVPDIKADTRAKIHTIATFLGSRGTLLFCGGCYFGATLLSIPFLHELAALLGTAYLLMIITSLYFRQSTQIFRIYTWFPLLNTAAGFLIFLYIFIKK